MIQVMLSRRRLITAAIGAGASLGGGVSVLAAFSDGGRSTPGYVTLAAVCSALCCPTAIGEACLRSLPPSEASPDRLAALILGDVPSTGGDPTSERALLRAIRTQSRRDFAGGRISDVDGWTLSLTETRAYAFAALLNRRQTLQEGHHEPA